MKNDFFQQAEIFRKESDKNCPKLENRKWHLKSTCWDFYEESDKKNCQEGPQKGWSFGACTKLKKISWKSAGGDFHKPEESNILNIYLYIDSQSAAWYNHNKSHLLGTSVDKI